jgi:phosphocarrier protein
MIADASIPGRECLSDPMETTGQTMQAQVTIQNKLGLHARPAMSFVDLANSFNSQVTVKKGDQAVDGKSIMQMMLLAATQGTELLIQATGPDATAAISALRELVDRKFDEE